MITKDLQAVQIDGQLCGTAIDVTIHQDAMGHVMHQLANLYARPIEAFIRESSTNGFDATIERVPQALRAAALKGEGIKPIEVTLPSRLAPMFIIRDYGTGMDYEAILTIYSKFGASTKRESNDFNGALGFGCKAPLAYATQFSVTSVKNGQRVSLSVARKADGGITMHVVEGDPGNEVPTTEPQGTTVMAPVAAEDVEAVCNTARKFFQYWKPGTVLINGEQPETINPEMKLSPTLAVVKDGGGNRVVMANVAYPIPGGYVDTGLGDGYSLLAEVPIGDLEFAPSREALKTPHQDNKAALAKVEAEFKIAIKGAIQRKIDAAPDKPAALAAMLYWRAALPKEARNEDDTYRWRGNKLPSVWEIERQIGEPSPFMVSPVRSHPASRHEKKSKLSAKRFSRDLFVTGWTSTQLSSPQKERLLMWLNAEGPTLDHGQRSETEFVLCRSSDLPADIKPWINSKQVVSWKHIKDTYKLPSSSSGSGGGWGWKTVKGSYEDVWTETGKLSGETPASDIRQDKPIYYFPTRQQEYARAVAFLTEIHAEFTVVQLQANRVEKFKRDFPKVRHLRDGLEECWRRWSAGVTKDQLEALAISREYPYGRSVKHLDAKLVDDPDVKRAIRLVNMDLTPLESRDRVYGQILRKRLPVPDSVVDPMDRYPLAPQRGGNDHHMSHTYLYMNAVYAADQAAKANTTP